MAGPDGPDLPLAVNWTIDIPVEHPAEPAAAARGAAQPSRRRAGQAGGTAAELADAEAGRPCGRCSRRAAGDGARARSTSCRTSWPPSPAARRSCCRAATAPRPTSTTPSRTSAATSAPCCRWPSCSPTARRMPVVKVARIAGQYAKPRSSDIDSLGLPSYRGDIINSLATTPTPRRRPVPDGARLRQRLRRDEPGARGHHHRDGVAAGVHDWNQEFVLTSAPASGTSGSPVRSTGPCAS